jgi:hypothetical protein
MNQYDNTNRGSIWPNDKKETENHPDFKGSINVEGKEYWVSAWKRKPDANPKAPSLSFSVQSKDAVVQAGNAVMEAPQVQQSSGFDDSFSDSIPF